MSGHSTDATPLDDRPLTHEQRELMASTLWVVEEQLLSLGQGHLLDADTLRAVGEDALMKAARRHDPAMGPFDVYAWTWISRKMVGALKAEGGRCSRLSLLRAAAVQAGLGAALEIEAPPEGADPLALHQHIEGACAGLTLEMFAHFVGGIEKAEGEEGAELREEYAGAIAALGEAMAELSPRGRKLFKKRVLDGSTWAEMASAFDVSASTAKTHYKEIQGLLRESLLTKGYTRPPPLEGRLTLVRSAANAPETRL
jgi:RNA polymerase sigma factor (sigma-70 family)